MNYPRELARADYLLTADELAEKYGHTGHGGEHPRFPQWEWRQEVAAENTLRSYWQWVEAQLEEEHNDG